jgi:hypothetical protein
MSVLKPGTLCITVGHRYTPSNNGRIVRVLHHAGRTWTGMVDGYVIEVVNGAPFSTIILNTEEGDRVLVRDRHTRCTAERSNLRPLLYPGIGHPILEQLAKAKTSTPVLRAKQARLLQKLGAERKAPEDTAAVTADAEVCEHGLIFLIWPHSQAARDWIHENVRHEDRWFGNALVVEHGYVAAIVDGLRSAGLEVQ